MMKIVGANFMKISYNDVDVCYMDNLLNNYTINNIRGIPFLMFQYLFHAWHLYGQSNSLLYI